MLTKTADLIQSIKPRRTALAAFNTYNLETTRAVLKAAESLGLPVILQLGVASLKLYGETLVAATLTAAKTAAVPAAVHLDHCSDLTLIEKCFEWGLSSALADGAHLGLEENIHFTRQAVKIARFYGGSIEAELGRLTGTEDGITIEALEASLTDPAQADQFVRETGADLLAVSIGNIHGYAPNPPPLDFERLQQVALAVDVPLVMHGASGMSAAEIRRTIEMGVVKLNVNTEVRVAFLEAVAAWGIRTGGQPDPRQKGQDFLDLTETAVQAAQQICVEKIRSFNLQ